MWEQRFGERLGQGGPHRLTPRESDVLRELARQYSTKQIAKALGLSPETVKHHLKRIFAKLGVRSREAALYEARRRAWMA
ncbi:response regulator transcription factor [Delftia sp. PS-11]|uniref:response regulator transcription factor n=1 Tax=Delftia sp. PS-11 TaxID=2767222 RepID=UPI0024582288|nr:LuxR C-terminal-related transcriptional regulator [Delftia sp. PS-11]KAJ8745987.1 response regulator transcription factor [Delftia sp. PS-11]